MVIIPENVALGGLVVFALIVVMVFRGKAAVNVSATETKITVDGGAGTQKRRS